MPSQAVAMRLLIALVLLLAACDSAGPGFGSAPAVQREFDGSRFTLRFAGDLVEVIRTSPEWMPRFETVARKAAFVVEAELPGCRPAWIEGDPAMMLMGLSCDGRKAPRRPKRDRSFFCDLTPGRSPSNGLTCSAR
jgi:hypothetical protein